jgi:hypothetical protein
VTGCYAKSTRRARLALLVTGDRALHAGSVEPLLLAEGMA